MTLPTATVIHRGAGRPTSVVLGVVVALAFVAALVGWKIKEPCGCGSKVDIAAGGGKKLALEAYPMWVLHHGLPATCPSAHDLAEMAGSERDPWGHRYEVFCRLDGGSPLVTSRGPDGKLGTRDDLDSTD